MFEVGDIIYDRNYCTETQFFVEKIVEIYDKKYITTIIHSSSVDNIGDECYVRFAYAEEHSLNKIYHTEIYQALLEANLEE